MLSKRSRWFPWPEGALGLQPVWSQNSALIRVQLQPGQGPQICLPLEARGMGQRLDTLLRFCLGANTLLARRWPRGRFAVQLHDEDPHEPCFRFDAPLDDAPDAGGGLGAPGLGAPGLGPLIPDPYCLMSQGYGALRQAFSHRPLPPWQERLPIAFWRGSSTGSKGITPATLYANPRYRLCRQSLRWPALVDARFTGLVQCADPASALQVRQQLEQEGLWSGRVEPPVAALHRWLIEIDGNVNSWGLLWKLLSGSCVLRVASGRRQWYHHRLQPWVHVVPVAPDLADLPERLDWCQSHPQACARIAAAGASLAQQVVADLEQDLLAATASYAQCWMNP